MSETPLQRLERIERELLRFVTAVHDYKRQTDKRLEQLAASIQHLTRAIEVITHAPAIESDVAIPDAPKLDS